MSRTRILPGVGVYMYTGNRFRFCIEYSILHKSIPIVRRSSFSYLFLSVIHQALPSFPLFLLYSLIHHSSLPVLPLSSLIPHLHKLFTSFFLFFISFSLFLLFFYPSFISFFPFSFSFSSLTSVFLILFTYFIFMFCLSPPLSPLVSRSVSVSLPQLIHLHFLLPHTEYQKKKNHNTPFLKHLATF